MPHPSCPNCQKAIPPDIWGKNEICPSCRHPVFVAPFPALLRKPEDNAKGLHAVGDDASCYFHENKMAVRSCDHCGRYICALCLVTLSDDWLVCPKCIQATRKGKTERASQLETERTRVGDIALAISVGPLLIFYFTVITAPLTLIYLWVQRRKPDGLLIKWQWRRWLAGLIALAEIIGWIVLFVFLSHKFSSFFTGKVTTTSSSFHMEVSTEEEHF